MIICKCQGSFFKKMLYMKFCLKKKNKNKTLIVLSSSNIYFLCDQKIPCLHLNQPTCLLVYFFCNPNYLALRIFFFFEKLFMVEQTRKVLKKVILFFSKHSPNFSHFYSFLSFCLANFSFLSKFLFHTLSIMSIYKNVFSPKI